MKAQVLIVEDETDLAELVRLYLEKDGIDAVLTETAEEGLELLTSCHFDLVVLDINLPGMDGFEFLQTLRRTSSVPVVVVSAREADEDIVMALGVGADEFVTKPFAPRVLVARLRALLRRVRAGSADESIMHFGPFTLDVEGYLLKKGDERIPLSSKEFEVLRYLVLNAGKALTPEEIYQSVWENSYGDLTIVAVYVRRLRNKIEENPKEPFYLQTIHGKGYRFNPEAVWRRNPL